MTREDFYRLPEIGWESRSTDDFTSFVIIPSEDINDNYRDMTFVGCYNSLAFVKISGCSDVLHFDGIDGLSCRPISAVSKRRPVSWTIDCLGKSGLLRIFCHEKIKHRRLTEYKPITISHGVPISSFEIFANREKQ